jgi:hypothetical protein
MRFFKKNILQIVLIFFSWIESSHGVAAELSLTYNYMRRTFDELNWFANQASTAGLSVYLGDRIAVEMSYTNGLYVKKERESALLTSTNQRTTTQFTNSYDGGLIFLFSDRQAVLQPYVRVGLAYIQRRQEVQIGDDIPFSITPKDATAPSAGLGARIMLGERFGIRLAIDSIQTPIDDKNYVYDFTGRMGLTWML